MSLLFTNGQDQKVDFGNIPALDNVSNMSILAWINMPSSGQNARGIIVNNLNGPQVSKTGFSFGAGSGNALEFIMLFDDSGTVEALWRANSVTTFDVWQHVAVTYNRTSTANDPVFYLDGDSKTVSDFAPTGSVRDDTGNILVSGNRDGDASQSLDRDFDGRIADLRMYNRIVSAGEVKDIADMRGAIDNLNGLVFHTLMVGASGLQTYDGVTLAGSNKLIDRINGVQGTPSGTTLPAGRGATHLAIGG